MAALLFWLLAELPPWAAASWDSSTFAAGNFRVQSAAGAFDGTEWWVFGGRGFDTSLPSPGFDYIDQLWAYDVALNTWRNASAPNGPTARSESSAVAIGNQVWIYGGGLGPNYAGDLFAFDKTSLSWTELTPSGAVPTTRRGHAAVVDGAGRMWVLGGYYSGWTQFDVWIYDVGGNSWSQAADGFKKLMGHSAVYDRTGSGKIWVFGGDPEGFGWYQTNELVCLDIALNSWSNFTQPSGPGGRAKHVAVIAANQGTEGTMWIHGGYLYDGSSTRYSDLWSYEIAGGTWTEFSSPGSMQRMYHVAAFDPATSLMWVYAGTYSSVVDSVHAYSTVGTTTTTTTTTALPVNAAEVVAMVEGRQAALSTALQGSLSPPLTALADGFTVAEQQDATLSGTSILSKAMLTPSSGLSVSYQNVTVEMPGALLDALQDGFVLSLALISESSSFFEFFLPPATQVLAAPIASVELYNSTGLLVSELAAYPILVTFPRPVLEGSGGSVQCVFWDDALQAWSTEGVSLYSQSSEQVTCQAEHLSLLALLFFPFACSNAAAIFSQQGLESLMDSSWAGQLPAVITWCLLLLGLGLLLLALRLDTKNRTHRGQLLRRLETCEEVKYTKKTSMTVPEEKMEFHPKVLKTMLLKHLHTQILLSELGVDLSFLKQLYITGGFSPVHAEALAKLESFYGATVLQRSALLFRAHCAWMKFSYPMMKSTSLQRCAETLAKFWSGLALVAMWYSSTALAAHQPPDCDQVKGLVEMIVRGFVVSTVGAIISFLPVLAMIIIQQKMMRKMGRTAQVIFWTFIALYFLLSLFVVLVFLASVSQVDGLDFLVGVITAVARTILVTPWVGVAFFLMFIACVEVDLAASLPFQKASVEGGQASFRVDVKSLSLTPADKADSGRVFKCQVTGLPEVVTVKEDAEVAPGVTFTGLAEHHLLLLRVYEEKRFVGSAAVKVGELEESQELPLQCRGKTLDVSLRLTAKLSETEATEFPALLDSRCASKGADGNLEPTKVEVQVNPYTSEEVDDELCQETI